MQPDILIKSPNLSQNKSPTLKMIIAIIVLSFVGDGYCIAQSNGKEKSKNTSEGVSSIHKKSSTTSLQRAEAVNTTTNDIQTKYVAGAYLKKDDPIFISINSRAVTDLKQSIKRSKPESPENKLNAPKVKAWPPEKQNQLQALLEKTIDDYTTQAHLDSETFLLVWSGFGETDQKEITENYDIRVQHLDDYKYIAEFWEDGLAANSEASALLWANKLIKRNPENKKWIVKTVKETYSNARKSINNGDKKRYTKEMALLYTKEKDGSITFHDPFQPMFDFISR